MEALLAFSLVVSFFIGYALGYHVANKKQSVSDLIDIVSKLCE